MGRDGHSTSDTRRFPQLIELLWRCHEELSGQDTVGWFNVDGKVEYITETLTAHLASPANCSVIIPDKGFLLGSVYQLWYSPDIRAAEWLFYIVPECRDVRLAFLIVREWEKEAASKGATHFTVGSSLGYKTDGVVKMYTKMGYTENTGRTLTKEI